MSIKRNDGIMTILSAILKTMTMTMTMTMIMCFPQESTIENKTFKHPQLRPNRIAVNVLEALEAVNDINAIITRITKIQFREKAETTGRREFWTRNVGDHHTITSKAFILIIGRDSRLKNMKILVREKRSQPNGLRNQRRKIPQIVTRSKITVDHADEDVAEI